MNKLDNLFLSLFFIALSNDTIYIIQVLILRLYARFVKLLMISKH